MYLDNTVHSRFELTVEIKKCILISSLGLGRGKLCTYERKRGRTACLRHKCVSNQSRKIQVTYSPVQMFTGAVGTASRITCSQQQCTNECNRSASTIAPYPSHMPPQRREELYLLPPPPTGVSSTRMSYPQNYFSPISLAPTHYHNATYQSDAFRVSSFGKSHRTWFG